MKQIIKTSGTSFLAILLLLVLSTSCKKNDPSTQAPTPAASGAFSYKVDGGATITVDSANATLYTTNKVRIIDVYAFKGGKQVMEFHFLPKTGDQTVGGTFGSGALLTYLETPTSSYDSQTGSFNVSTCDTVGKKIVGTFSFVGKLYPYTTNTTRTITEGQMTVTKLSKQ
jgi:hypothetical protein